MPGRGARGRGTADSGGQDGLAPWSGWVGARGVVAAHLERRPSARDPYLPRHSLRVHRDCHRHVGGEYWYRVDRAATRQGRRGVSAPCQWPALATAEGVGARGARRARQGWPTSPAFPESAQAPRRRCSRASCGSRAWWARPSTDGRLRWTFGVGARGVTHAELRYPSRVPWRWTTRVGRLRGVNIVTGPLL